ncbi:MAG TPA: TonB-dependent receptor [Oligoflexia bacterium]|nr:TonB-dependent receptor [Oligoflexia bacterium]HMP48235.1 TonB-dependent receptor [Oligoflexia bacterium]
MIQVPPNQLDITSASALDTQTKAVTLNRDQKIYGTFAEIGAGQEIAAWFFRVGGASGTVAKTMSAYDMKVSDDIYGKTTRYVSEARLLSMLDHEFQLLQERLGPGMGEHRSFFVIANTVSARNYEGTNECHGWIGVRFQRNPKDVPSDIILHVNMLDQDNILQQQAIGLLGVNLLYGAYMIKDNLESFLTSLLDDIKPGRIEVDVAYFRGPYFPDWNDALVGIHLIEDGLAEAVLFSPDGKLEQPSSIIRKKPVLIERGTYRVLNKLAQESVKKAIEMAEQGKDCGNTKKSPREVLYINEVSIRSVHHNETMQIEELSTLLPRLFGQGSYVMITDFAWYYNVSNYLRRYTSDDLCFIMGTGTIMKLLSGDVYDSESGNILEALGKLLAIGVKIISYPISRESIEQHPATSKSDLKSWHIPEMEMISATDIEPTGLEKHLYRYLIESGSLLSV